VAAARQVRLTDRKLAAQQGSKVAPWQTEAWDYFDAVPEIKESVRYRGNQLGKVRLYVAVDNPDDPQGEPVPVSDPDSGVPPAVAAAATAELDRLRSVVGGQPEVLRMLDMNLEVAGECWLVGLGERTEMVKQRDGTTEPVVHPEDWVIRSVSEVTQQDGVYKLRAGPSDAHPRELNEERDTIIRIWTRHPQWSEQADSAMRGLLGECRTLQVLTQQVQAHAYRALSAGFLTVASELSFGPADPTKAEGEGNEGDELDAALQDVLVAPVEDPASAASVQPGIIRGPAEYLKPDVLRRITFYDADVVAGLEDRVRARIDRIARGLNLPVEKVMGHQNTTYANAAQVDEDEYNDYLAPSVAVATDALTAAFLRSQLNENAAVPAEWVQRLYVAADPAGLIAAPDTQANADSAHDRNTISDDAYRKAKGFGPDDAPEPTELLIKAGLRRGILTADLTVLLLNVLTAKAGLPPIELPEREGEAPPEGPPEPEAVARMLQLLADDPEAVARLAAALGLANGNGHAPPAALGTGPPPFQPRVVAAAPPPGSPDFGRQLTELDRDLRSRLLVATNDAMGRALERAANRLRSRTNGTELRTALRTVPLRASYAHLGPHLVAQVLADADPLADAWDELGEQFRAWGATAQAAALDVLAAVAGGLPAGMRADLEAQQAADLASAWAWLAGALTTLAGERLYDPDPAAPAEGEHDPTLAVPAGLVRQAIARAGGAQGLVTAAATAPGPAWVTLTDAGTRPAGGIGTGELLRGGLRDVGASVEAYRWTYGPAFRQRPFQPHLGLDGVVFTNFDDPQLANPNRWPPGAYYLPGDHAGCICDFEPIIVPAAPAAGPPAAPTEQYPGGLTPKEATKWMADRWGTMPNGTARGIHLSDLSAEAANGMAEVMHDMMARHPKTAARLRLFGSSAGVTRDAKQIYGHRARIGNISSALADAQREPTVAWIRLNRGDWGTDAYRHQKMLQQVERSVATGHFTPEAGGANVLASTIRHEFGHHIKYRADEAHGRAAVATKLSSVLEQHVLATRGVRKTDVGYTTALRDAVEKDLSRYAATNLEELCAEATAEASTSTAPRPLARALYDALVQLAEG
jgi:hypothetical protein